MMRWEKKRREKEVRNVEGYRQREGVNGKRKNDESERWRNVEIKKDATGFRGEINERIRLLSRNSF